MVSRASIVGLTTLILGCSGVDRDQRDPTALVLIVIDTLRADRLGHTGYAPASTPTLDSLAARGARFSHATTPVPTTLPAVTSLLTGLYPTRHGVRDNGRFRLEASFETLAERFRAAGWRTGAVLASAVLEKERGLAQGFESWDADFEGEYPVYRAALRPFAEELATDRRRADVVTDRALERLRQLGDSRFFLFVHYFDVHMHYDPPPRFDELHPERPYDGEVSFVDEEIGRLLSSVPESALVVVVSDHGEAQGEHGEPQHGFLLYDATLRIPMIVSGPGVPEGAVRDEAVSLVDLEPTLARIFELPSDGTERDGRVLAWTGPEPEVVPLYAETFHPLVSYGWSELRSIRSGDRKLIEGAGVSELYDLDDDPGELRNLGAAAVPPALRESLAVMVRGDDPEEVYAAAHSAPDAQSRAELASLGYLSAPSARTNGPRPHPRRQLPRWVARQQAKMYIGEAAVRATEGDFAVALKQLDRALTLDPRAADAHHGRGRVYEHVGELARAERDYRAAIKTQPDHLSSHRSLARLLTREGRDAEAIAQWEKVLKLAPEDVEALEFLAE